MAMTRRLYSISGLATELGRDRRTVAKALETVRPDGDVRGGKAWYLATALAALTGGLSGGKLDPLQERARKDKELADKTAMENELRRGEICEVAVVAETVGKLFSIVRQRVLAIPSKVAGRIPREVRDAVFEIVEREIHEALRELSEDKIANLADA